MAFDWSQCEVVESVPGKVSGAWVFRGTRIPVASVFENLEDGLTADEIVRMFEGLTRAQVNAVLEFCRTQFDNCLANACLYSIREHLSESARPSLDIM